MVGSSLLSTLLADRKKGDELLREEIGRKTAEWGVTAMSVEIRDISVPDALQDAMSREAQAQREAAARVHLGDAELLVAQKFVDAAEIYGKSPAALQLRAMNIIYETTKERGATILMPTAMVDAMNPAGLFAALGKPRSGGGERPMIKTLVLAALLAGATATAAMAQDPTGDWIGTVKTPGAELTVTVHVAKGANGALEGYAGSPDQTPNPLPMTDIAVKDGTLTFAVPVVQGELHGQVGRREERLGREPDPAGPGHAADPGPRQGRAASDGGRAPWTASGPACWQTPQGDLRIVLKVKTDANGTLAMFSRPTRALARWPPPSPTTATTSASR
jgi:hypothetical protein